MKTAPTPKTVPPAPPGPAAVAAPVAATVKATDLGLTERRRSIRPLPTPQAVESQGDSDWAIFQALISDNQRI